jgi:hypothetical protein
MPDRLKIHAGLALSLAVVFYIFFMTTKHDPALSAVNPFADDPYDAVGSFGIQVSGFLAILALIRAFRDASSDEQKRLVLRTELAADLAVVVTLVLDGVAMIRFQSLWLDRPAGSQLAALLGGMTIVAGGAMGLVWFEAARLAGPGSARPWKRAVMVCALAVIIAAVYPAEWLQSIPGALLSVLVGVLLLFAPLWALGPALVPPEVQADQPRRYRSFWSLIVLLGAGVAVFFIIGESTAGGTQPFVMMRFFVIAIYLGLETAGLLIGYALLRRQLGLVQSIPA